MKNEEDEGRRARDLGKRRHELAYVNLASPKRRNQYE